jgi:quinol monooxygenase YgiN
VVARALLYRKTKRYGFGRHAMIQTIIKIRARPEKRKELLQTAQALKVYTKKERGCLGYDVYQDPEDENTILFIGEWKSPNDLKLYMNSERFGVFVGANRVLAGHPEISLNTISHREVLNDFEALDRG